MAKESRRGLGRGLGALIEISEGNTYIQEEKPIVEETHSEVEIIPPVAEPVVESYEAPANPEPLNESIPAEDNKQPQPYIYGPEDDDHVVIREVTSRPVVDATELELPIEEIAPNPDQPRSVFKKEEIEELAESISKDGLLQPILVRKVEQGGYQIIAGERRWQACVAAGLKKVPVRIRQADDDEALELALIENIQRSDLNPIEEAYGYRRLMERRNMTQSEVARAVSKGRSTIANSLRLLELPEQAQQLLFEEKITAGHARAILSIPSVKGRQKLTEKMATEKISVREAETIARLFAGKSTTDSQKRAVATPKRFKAIAKHLREALETNVRVKTVQGKNKIEIEFQDEEELERLFQNITAFTRE